MLASFCAMTRFCLSTSLSPHALRPMQRSSARERPEKILFMRSSPLLGVYVMVPDGSHREPFSSSPTVLLCIWLIREFGVDAA